MKIAFDVDNVLADSMESWCKKASKLLNREIRKEEIKSHKIVGSVPMPPTEIFRLQGEVWIDWQNLPPTESKLSQKISTFRKHGFEVFIITSRPLRFTDLVRRWLKGQKILYDQFFAIGPYRMKRETRVDTLVDDDPIQIRDFSQTGGTGFLYSQPWNMNENIKKAIVVKSIYDVVKYYRLDD